MFERILMPLDGTEAGEAVLRALGHVLKRWDAEVILLHAAPVVPATRLDHSAFRVAGEAEVAASYLEKTRARLESEGLKVRTLLREGSPADVILQAAASENAALIALATHGRTGIARWALGSVTEEVLRRSPVPVLVDRHAAEPLDRSRPRTILVAYDGQESSLAITPTVIELARILETEVALVRVEEEWGSAPSSGFVGHRMDEPIPTDGRPDLPDRDLIEAGNPFAKAGLRTTVFRVRGEIAEQINKLAKLLPADLIAMATHGRRGVARLLSGSVTEDVVRSAEIPLLILNSGARKAPLDDGVST